MTHQNTNSPQRHLPVRPNLDQLKRQAKELLAKAKSGEPSALLELSQAAKGASPKLADAQHALALSYGAPHWNRLQLACQVCDAIWQNRVEDLRDLVLKHPYLLVESVRVQPDNWGPPLSYSANLGRDEIISMLLGLGASDIQKAFSRACLQGRLETARLLFAQGAGLPRGCIMGPCETLNADGLKLLLELGAEFCDESGSRLAPLALILQTYSRNPQGKARCLHAAASEGLTLPKTAPFEVLTRDFSGLSARFLHEPEAINKTHHLDDFYPLSLGCSEDRNLALHGAPLEGGTLLHLSIDNGDLEMAGFLLEKGADPNAKASVDEEGFGGHTALYGALVSQPFRVGRDSTGHAELLLKAGIDTTPRATLRKSLRFVEDESEHIYQEVTALEFAERFHDQDWVNPKAFELVRQQSVQDLPG